MMDHFVFCLSLIIIDTTNFEIVILVFICLHGLRMNMQWLKHVATHTHIHSITKSDMSMVINNYFEN